MHPIFASIPVNKVIVAEPITSQSKLLIVVPAKKYSMDGILFEKIASLAVRKGYVVVRFNWIFFTQGSNPSKNFDEEASELKSIIEYYQKKYRVEAKNTVVAAKSFGSKILMKIPSTTYNALGLITPNCDKVNTFSSVYGKVLSSLKPIQISISTNDPYCEISQIYKETSKFKNNIRLYTSFGDHNFLLNGNEENQDVFVNQFINWLANI